MGTFFHLRRPSWSRRFTLLAATFLGALTVGGVAAAENIVVTHVPLPIASFNPCTLEGFAGDGFLHTQTYERMGADGSVNFHLEVNFQNAKGVTPTGAKYVVPTAFSDTFNDIPPGTVTNLELMSQFIRQKEVDGVFVLDPGDDFWANIKVVFVVNANGVVTVNRFDFEPINCK